MNRSMLLWLTPLACALAVLPRPAQAQTLSRGPYLQMVTPSSVVVVWRTSTATASRVFYGTAQATLSLTVDATGTGTQHEVRITGLQPNTKYFYAVGFGTTKLGGNDANHYFVTSPQVGTRQRFRAWVVGDSGTGDSNQLAVRNAMATYTAASRPDLFLHLGDIAYDSGTEAEFQGHFFDPYQDTLRNTVCWPTLGNHEGVNSDSATQTGPYYAAYVLPTAAEAGGLASGTKAYYSFDYANVHFVVLDSQDSPRTPTGAMLTWLRNDLASTDQDWIIAYWHHPPYSKGSHNSDTESQLVQMRENAVPILEAGGVDLVLSGHSHTYERSYLVNGATDTPTTAAGHIVNSGDGKPDGGGAYHKRFGQNANEGAVYAVAGHGGAGLGRIGTHPLMFFTQAAHGSCILEVDGLTLTLHNVLATGVVPDSFSLVKGALPTDGGVVVADGGVRDGGSVVADGGLRDGGSVGADGGLRDGGLHDGGSVVADGGVRDGGRADAGTSGEDGGAVQDDAGLGAQDGGLEADGGAVVAPASGCGCSQPGEPGSLALLGPFIAAALLLRRRRARPGLPR